MFRIICRLFWLIPMWTQHLHAQSYPTDPSEYNMLFKAEAIRSAGIRHLEAQHSFKYDLKPIVQSKERSILHFNPEGQLNRLVKIKPFRGRMDSIQVEYFYDPAGNITTMVKSDPKYTYVDLMEYRGSELSKHQFYQMRKTNHWNENLSDKFLMWSDSIVKTQDKYEVYNVFGLKYRSHIVVEKDGRTSQIRTFDHSGKLLKTLNYTYKDQELVLMEEIQQQALMFNWKKTFEYRDGLLTEIIYFKDGLQEYVQKISYDEQKIPELDLKRNESNKKMTIVKYSHSR